jgi:hypothetical protein
VLPRSLAERSWFFLAVIGHESDMFYGCYGGKSPGYHDATQSCMII